MVQVKVAEEAATAAVSTLTGTVIGALLVLAVAVAIWAVVRLNKVQGDRVSDQQKMVGELTRAQGSTIELTKELLERFGKNASAMEDLRRSIDANSERMRELTSKVDMSLVARSTGGKT